VVTKKPNDLAREERMRKMFGSKSNTNKVDEPTPLVKAIMSMGFDRAKIEAALIICGGKKELMLDYLKGEKKEKKDKDKPKPLA
jgi:hypothetical protein